MNHGIVFSKNKCVWVKNDGSLREMEWSVKYEIDDLLKNIGPNHFSTNHRCAVTFCGDVIIELKKILLNKVKAHVGQVKFFLADIHKVIFSGSYSIPKQKQICLSIENGYAQLFLFEKGETYKESCIRLGTSQSSMVKKGHATTTHRDLSETERYVLELGNDQIAESLACEILNLMKTVDKSVLDQGVIGFMHNSDEYTNLLTRIEKFIKLPVICINTNFQAIEKYMIEVVKDKNIFEYVIKLP